MRLKAEIKLTKQIKNWIQIGVVRPCLWTLYIILHTFSIKRRNRVVVMIIEKHFFDNTKALAPVLSEEKDLDVGYIVKHESVRKEMIEAGYQVMPMLSIKALIFFLTAPFVIFSYGSSFIEMFPYFISPRWQEITFMGHGIPVKALSRLVPKYQHYGNHLLLQQYSHALCSGKPESETLCHAHNISIEETWITGMPRTDRLVELMQQPSSVQTDIKKGDRSAILYAPTWRAYGKTDFFPFEDFDLTALKKWLDTHHAILYFRVHKEDLHLNKSFFDQLDMEGPFRMVNQDFEADAVEILPQFDLLISDFSAIVTDFLPIDRPIVFIPYDYKEYEEQVGFLFPYSKMTTGDIVDSQVSLLEALESGLNHPERDQKERQTLCNELYDFVDTKSSLRVVAEIKRALFEKQLHP
ncbi:CDP-glycerol glycerophosphotransferase family protein [Halosquirtibacter laminarini]|uniref:CDP-glycerol glycerophosphotransferase family protein n=1 Tax=Halosquirtibacter laminarini TaxID=3374600 RepID=A0AC61NQZ2_9BACT|nr:CDP-glycerol glycerophosphotransferase family protein [Prolixibacteraceae bacterium]